MIVNIIVTLVGQNIDKILILSVQGWFDQNKTRPTELCNGIRLSVFIAQYKDLCRLARVMQRAFM